MRLLRKIFYSNFMFASLSLFSLALIMSAVMTGSDFWTVAIAMVFWLLIVGGTLWKGLTNRDSYDITDEW